MKQDHYDSTPIGEVSYTGGDTIVVRLTLAFAQELADATAEQMSTDSLFLKAFKGIYLAVDTANAQAETGGRVSYFNFSDAILSMYYRNTPDDVADSARYYYYYIDDYSPNFNVYKHSSAHLANSSSDVYLEGLAGVKPYIDFNNVKNSIQHLADSLEVDIAKIAINKAELLVQLAYPGNDMNTYPAMTTMAYKQDSVYTFVVDTYQTYFDGNLNRSLQQYAYNLTYYTQGLYTGHAEDNTPEAQQLMIFPTGVTNDYYSTIVLDRTYYSFGVLKGPGATIKLTYTVLK